MKFTRISLQNFKCYGDADLRLNPGVTVIHGVNGSGKTSLLEAAFFALYGARALDATLDEVVTTGAEETVVELWFTHAGGEYYLKRRVRATGGRPTTAECVLEGPEATYDGARDVGKRVAELLRMDHEAFVNCAYVRQGEVNKLINATPGERQDMIDELLQLGKLEAYRSRASDARVGVGRVRDDKQGALAQLDEQIETKEAKNLHGTLNDLQSDLRAAESEIERFEEQRETAVETLEQAQSALEEYEQKRETLDAVEDDIEDLETTITDTERKRESLQSEITELRSTIEGHEEAVRSALAESEFGVDAEINAVENRLAELDERDETLRDDLEGHRLEATEHESEAESARERADSLRSQATEKRQRAYELEDEIEATESKLEERRERVADLEDTIEELRGRFEDAPIDVGEAERYHEEVAADLEAVREELAELSAEIDQKRESIDRAETLLEAGKCPECGQDVGGSPHVESLDDQREELEALQEEESELQRRRDRLEERLDRADGLADAEGEIERLRERRDTVEQLLAEQAEDIEGDREHVTELRKSAVELEDEAEETLTDAKTAEERAEQAREQVGSINERRADLKERRQRLEAALDALESIDEAEREVERLRERRSDLAETNEERRERLAEKRERRSELAQVVDDSQVEAAREQKQNAEEYIERVDEQLESLRERRDNLRSRIGGVENELQELESLREQREEIETVLGRLESLYDETEQLESMYGQLRAELRRRNVETLERMLNDTFELIYQNASYSRIELDGDYELTVHQKNGDTLDPEQLSGGERALFNLSLRTAIYRLLSEGIEGTAPMPPLVLDEPTVFLDSGHVSQLVALIEQMRELGVEQIVVVSHDEELIGAADDLVHVEKDPTSNRSHVERLDSTALATSVQSD
ncbi:MAG: DNA double-strand break repair ATPase Rad50 [Halapricum sp.]